MIDPKKEGITHVNAYSKSQSKLGRYLSNFAHARVNTPDGRFESVEGYWYWLGLPEGCSGRDDLRHLWGYRAKARGRELRESIGSAGEPARIDPDFQKKIRLAVRSKLAQADRSLLELPEASLPVEHYYVFGGHVRSVRGLDWLKRVWNEELALARSSR